MSQRTLPERHGRFRRKNLENADESLEFPLVAVDAVNLGEMTVARVVTEPGWRWSTHMKPMVGGDWCLARHIGVVLSGSMGVVFSDGTEIVCGPDDVFDIPPQHDGYVVGNEPLVTLEWSGHRTFVRNLGASRERILTTLLFTDFVGSTGLVAQLGDHALRELTVEQFQEARSALDRFAGREVNTTGDGILAIFDGPASALRCAASIRAAAERAGLKIRAGVHIGEVELVGSDVRGLAVHQAARIMDAAEPNEVLVSDTTRALCLTQGSSSKTAVRSGSRVSRASIGSTPSSVDPSPRRSVGVRRTPSEEGSGSERRDRIAERSARNSCRAPCRVGAQSR